MPRRPRVEKEGFHHIVNRGVARGNIFVEDERRGSRHKYKVNLLTNKMVLSNKMIKYLYT